MSLAFKFKKKERIKKKEDFKEIINDNNKIRTKFYTCFFKKNKFKENRIGIIIKKKIGNSVKRNYEKRIIRNFFRINKNKIKESCDLIIILNEPDGGFLEKKNDFERIIAYILSNE